jgi:hypothetical protein
LLLGIAGAGLYMLANWISKDQLRARAEMKWGIGLVAFGLMLATSCEKSECAPPEITGIVGNVAQFKPAGEYLIEMEGLDNPYKGTIKVTGTSYKLEGEKYRIRMRSACSGWSEWFYKP